MGGADGQLAAQVGALVAAALDVPRPPTALPGWEGLCAGEYAQAAHALWTALDSGVRALRNAQAALVTA